MNSPSGNAFLSISDADLDYLFAHREFPETVIHRSEKVAVIMTQDWCPQWAVMKAYLPDFSDRISVFVLEYNRHPQFEKIMEFKEKKLGNWDVPYLRFYQQGVFISDSNYLPKSVFVSLAGIDEKPPEQPKQRKFPGILGKK